MQRAENNIPKIQRSARVLTFMNADTNKIYTCCFTWDPKTPVGDAQTLTILMTIQRIQHSVAIIITTNVISVFYSTLVNVNKYHCQF